MQTTGSIPVLKIGAVEFPTPLTLAPMVGYTDLPFRRCIRELGGVGLAWTEMLSPRSILLGGGKRRKAILAQTPDDRPLIHQIYGHDPDLMQQAARWLVENGAERIDINMGCPQRKICTGGAGAGLLRNPERAVAMVRGVVECVPVPVTAKIRLGWDHTCVVAVELALALEAAGVAAITVHGRTRGQGFTGRADLDAIAGVVRAIHTVPVIGNGDIMNVDQALHMFRHTGCQGIMIGRGILKDPWLIANISRALGGQPPLDVSRAQQREFLLRHYERTLEHYGARGGILVFRKWIPQYARKLLPDRETMVRLLRIADADALRTEFAALSG